jgi:hypothetical protein
MVCLADAATIEATEPSKLGMALKILFGLLRRLAERKTVTARLAVTWWKLASHGAMVKLGAATGLKVELHTVTVTDSKGCTDAITIRSHEPSPVADAADIAFDWFRDNNGNWLQRVQLAQRGYSHHGVTAKLAMATGLVTGTLYGKPLPDAARAVPDAITIEAGPSHQLVVVDAADIVLIVSVIITERLQRAQLAATAATVTHVE